MPRVMTKPKFKPDELVVAFDAFAGAIDGTPFVCNPTEVLRGDDPIVLAYSAMFGRDGDKKARAAYWDAHFAAQTAERERQRAAEAKQAEEQAKRVQALADKLEPEERKRRKQQHQAAMAPFKEETERRRRSLEENERQAQKAHEYGLAMAEVDRRLANESAA